MWSKYRKSHSNVLTPSFDFMRKNFLSAWTLAWRCFMIIFFPLKNSLGVLWPETIARPYVYIRPPRPPLFCLLLLLSFPHATSCTLATLLVQPASWPRSIAPVHSLNQEPSSLPKSDPEPNHKPWTKPRGAPWLQSQNPCLTAVTRVMSFFLTFLTWSELLKAFFKMIMNDVKFGRSMMSLFT